MGDLHAVWDWILLLLLAAPACELKLTYDLVLKVRRIRLPGIVYENGAREGRAGVGRLELDLWIFLPTIFSSVFSIESSLAFSFFLLYVYQLLYIFVRNLSSTEIEKQKRVAYSGEFAGLV